MTYKYQKYISQFTNCPPSRYEEVDVLEAFRWVHDEGDANSFIPPFQKNPKRVVEGKDKGNCAGFALSLFDSQYHAKKRYLALAKKLSQRFIKDVGQKVAVGNIQKCDGKCSPIDSNGHFEIHEYANTVLTDRFSVVEEIDIAENNDDRK